MGASRTSREGWQRGRDQPDRRGIRGRYRAGEPVGGEFMGQKFYTSLEEYGKPIDMSVIAVPTAAVKDSRHQLAQGQGAGRSRDHGRLQGSGRGGRPAGARDRRSLPFGRGAPDGPELPGPDQHPPQDERHLRQPHADRGRDLGPFPVGRALHRHPRLGGLPQDGTGHPAEHREQGRSRRDRLPGRLCGRREDQGHRGLPGEHRFRG